MKSVLVTGGAGYIGSHTAKALAHAGFQPIVLDNLTAGHRWAVQWGPFVEGNAGDTAIVRRVCEQYEIAAAIHLAARAYVGESIEDPRFYFQNNVVQSLNFVDALINAGVKQIVFSSSCATYGVPQQIPIHESHAQSPVNPYGESKLFIERALRWYSEPYAVKSVCLRYFNACGADPDGALGEEHSPETHLIPLLLFAARDRTSVKVFGNDYETTDGTAVRDYVHVADLAEAHVRAVEYLVQGGPSAAFNLGTGTGHSVREVVKTVERITHRTLRIAEESRRPGDPDTLVAAAGAARDVLGWTPTFTGLDGMVETAWAWYQRNTVRQNVRTHKRQSGFKKNASALGASWSVADTASSPKTALSTS